MRTLTDKKETRVSRLFQTIEDTTGAHPVSLFQMLTISVLVVFVFMVGYSVNLEQTRQLQKENDQLMSSKHYFESFVVKADEYLYKNNEMISSLVYKCNNLTTSVEKNVALAHKVSGVPTILIKALMAIESGCTNPQKNRFSNAVGPMQIILSHHRLVVIRAAQECGLSIELPRNAIKNVCANIVAGSLIYADLLKRSGGNRYIAALAYNVGPTKIDEVLRDSKDKSFSEFLALFPSDLDIIRRRCYEPSFKRSNKEQCANVFAEAKKPNFQKRNVFVYKFASFLKRSSPHINVGMAHASSYDLS